MVAAGYVEPEAALRRRGSQRPETTMTTFRWPPYADGMDQMPTIEDSRGVDLSQIRRQLRMSVEDRVRHMVVVANTLMSIRATTRLLDPPRAR